MYDGIKPEARGSLAGQGTCPDCLGTLGRGGEAGCVCEPAIYFQLYGPPDAKGKREIIKAGEVTEQGLETIRQGMTHGQQLSAIWPLTHGRKSTGLSGTLEGWMGRQRG